MSIFKVDTLTTWDGLKSATVAAIADGLAALANKFDKAGGPITGNVTVGGTLLATGALGYGPGAGGTVTQATSKATSVTINKTCGQITTANSALAANTVSQFQVLNNTVSLNDAVVISLRATGLADATVYEVRLTCVNGAGFLVYIKNLSGASVAESLIINFAVIKSSPT